MSSGETSPVLPLQLNSLSRWQSYFVITISFLLSYHNEKVMLRISCSVNIALSSGGKVNCFLKGNGFYAAHVDHIAFQSWVVFLDLCEDCTPQRHDRA